MGVALGGWAPPLGLRASRPPATANLGRSGTSAPSLGIGNIDRLIFVVRENPSFDHSCGTFPGANGLPVDANGAISVCLPDPERHACDRAYHDTNLYDAGGPHNVKATRITVDGGAMDGTVQALEVIGNSCRHNPTQFECRQ